MSGSAEGNEQQVQNPEITILNGAIENFFPRLTFVLISGWGVISRLNLQVEYLKVIYIGLYILFVHYLATYMIIISMI